MRAGYAAPVLSAVAFLVAAGLSLDASRTPGTGPGAAVVAAVAPVDAPTSYEPGLAGVYQTTWGIIELGADGSARGWHGPPADARPAHDVDGRWHTTASLIHFEWGTGSYAAAREWWKPTTSR